MIPQEIYKLVETGLARVEEELTRQVQEMVKKISLPDEWRDAYLKKLETENADVRHSSNLFVQNLKTDISAVSARLSRLTDVYLNEALELGEYLERKNALTAEKRTLEEKLSDFERKGNHWLELMRNWILEANQAGNLIKQENLSGMKDFLADIGSNRRVAAGMLLAEFKMPWRDLAETSVRARALGAGEVNLSSNSELWTRRELNPHLRNLPRLNFYGPSENRTHISAMRMPCTAIVL